ncbi:MAG: stage V sporulation protein T [Clostridiales bacterium]|jgi:AbrB family transcriptional regulator (stage V sporulation protein T)|nr:stage V sporulation protein T [Clostridiales bacterium]
MKATGIVRRIDDLGRVVIPKEIRRTMRIREGDPLEIFTTQEGEVIFKKYSPIGEFEPFAIKYAETLTKTSGHPTVITDRDTIVAVYGVPKNQLNNKKVSAELENIMNDKLNIIVKPNEKMNVPVADGIDKYSASVVCPIISEGDSIGTVVFLNDGKKETIGVVEEKLAETAAGFLSKQME